MIPPKGAYSLRQSIDQGCGDVLDDNCVAMNGRSDSTRDLKSGCQQGRDISLDFVKGVLVLFMLTFHTGSLFLQDAQLLWLLNDILLNFVSGSWVFLTGYLVVLRYGNKIESDESGVRRRLIMRGAKIIGAYILLNIVIVGLGWSPRRPVEYDLSTITRIFSYGGGEATSFGVLLGIGYLLLLAPYCLSLQHKSGMFIWLVVIATCITSSLDITISSNLWLLLCGLAGMTIGFWFDGSKIQRITRDPTGCVYLFVFGLLGATTHYTLFLLSGVTRRNLLVYLLGVISIVTIVYAAHRWYQSRGYFEEWVRLLGRYSLTCYVLQMGILWGLWWLASSLETSISFPIALVVSFGILEFIVWSENWLVCNHQAFAKIYSYAFR